MSAPSIDFGVLDQLIVGRVQPHIYAFATNTIPNYLKVGDTYRPVAMRLRVWRKHFPDLEKEYEGKANVAADVYFRDYAVHQYLEIEAGKARLADGEQGAGVYYSREFFADTSAVDVEDAIADIQSSFDDNSGRYDFYDAEDRLPVEHHYVRGEDWTLRPNQRAAVGRFIEAVEAGRANLLMYAVMRFGKSFTSLCCAKAMAAKTVLVMSAKADVKTEWKKTVETAGNFSEYVFLDSDSLSQDENAMKEALAEGQSVVLFLTLQDLQGKNIKDKHQELFKNQIDLLVVDETHFGARAEEYGRILKEAGQPADDATALRRVEDDQIDTAEAEEQLKVLQARIRLHLSGTPYRILMGSEFSKEDIIAFVQFSDIVGDQEAWDSENLDKDDVNEWDNPYFGFPQMVRFAFKPSKAARQKMEELSKSGISLALSALLEPRSIRKDNDDLHKQFKHEPEILDLLRVIDGSQQDDNLLGFLDYDRIKQGMMCRHMVMVLPYCASCDAMEALIQSHSGDFRNLGDYQIINISGVEGARRYRSPEDVKKAISDAEAAGRKTLTLTVNRMLTGSTVEQWDTMLYLKDTSSPQEYDQATFRLQNQYVRTLFSEREEGQTSTIRNNLKPQTLLVDFDPDRLFRMQEQKSLIYNVNTDENGNAKLEERIKEELRISPIITLNAEGIHQVDAADILAAVSEYSSKRSVGDEACDIPIDLDVLRDDDIRRVIEAQAELGSKSGLTLEPFDGEENDLDMSGEDDDTDQGGSKATDEYGRDCAPPASDDSSKSLARKLQTYYQRILFFAMLATDEVRSLAGIVDVIEEDNNARIARHLFLDPGVLRALLRVFDPFKLSCLDYKIQNISQLVHDEMLEPVERAARALGKFTRISDSEVRTPSWLCHDMIAQIPGEKLAADVEEGRVFLDIASKSGEFALALYERLVQELGVEPIAIKSMIYSIPSSSIAYEFTRRFYEILDLDVKNIASSFNAYDLVEVSEADGRLVAKDVASVLREGDTAWSELALDAKLLEGSVQMEFSAVVGNPPYQADDGGFGTSAAPIYQLFVELGKQLDPQFLSMVIPSRWFAGGKGLDSFRTEMLHDSRIRTLHDYLTASDVFPDVGLKGGVCHFLRDRDNPGDCTVTTQYKDETPSVATRPLLEKGADVFIRFNEGISILKKVMAVEGAGDSLSLPDEKRFDRLVSSRKPFGLTTTFKGNGARSNGDVLVYRNGGVGYTPRSSITLGGALIDKWKLFIGRAAAGTGNKDTYPHRIIPTPFVGKPGSISSETYLCIGPFDEHEDAQNALSYLECRLTRLLILLHKPSQDVTRKVYTFVPVQNFSRTWTDEDLYAKYGLSATEIAFAEKMVRSMGKTPLTATDTPHHARQSTQTPVTTKAK
ncbi:MAG: Eco57I restriction-modification methylase domain-containing protein [Propionibacteriaceae bacterium]|jgi:hypothetical protein|nr:Eco57I restriction-modification methylase domain-containing protein [Propionibacteriaceae bacterium]